MLTNLLYKVIGLCRDAINKSVGDGTFLHDCCWRAGLYSKLELWGIATYK